MTQIKEEHNKDKRPPRNEGEDNILGKRMKELRDKQGLSLGKLAKVINKTKASVIGYEQGYRFPLLRDIDKLAEALGTSVGYLIGETDISGPPVTGEKIEDSLKTTLSELIKNGDIHEDGRIVSNEELELINAHLRKLLNEGAVSKDNEEKA